MRFLWAKATIVSSQVASKFRPDDDVMAAPLSGSRDLSPSGNLSLSLPSSLPPSLPSSLPLSLSLSLILSLSHSLSLSLSLSHAFKFRPDEDVMAALAKRNRKTSTPDVFALPPFPRPLTRSLSHFSQRLWTLEALSQESSYSHFIYSKCTRALTLLCVCEGEEHRDTSTTGEGEEEEEKTGEGPQREEEGGAGRDGVEQAGASISEREEEVIRFFFFQQSACVPFFLLFFPFFLLFFPFFCYFFLLCILGCIS